MLSEHDLLLDAPERAEGGECRDLGHTGHAARHACDLRPHPPDPDDRDGVTSGEHHQLVPLPERDLSPAEPEQQAEHRQLPRVLRRRVHPELADYPARQAGGYRAVRLEDPAHQP